MFCRNCGKEISPDERFCANCGTPIGRKYQTQKSSDGVAPIFMSPDMYERTRKYTERNEQESRHSDINEQVYHQEFSKPYETTERTQVQPVKKDMPMKWFKFIIYFQLFANALTYLAFAVLLFTGSHYGDSDMAAMVYAWYGKGLKICDMSFAMIGLLLAAMAIYIRFQLAGYKKIGPKLYLIFLAAGLVFGVMYIFVESLILGINPADVINSSFAVSWCVSVVMLIVNFYYFGHRMHMFQN